MRHLAKGGELGRRRALAGVRQGHRVEVRRQDARVGHRRRRARGNDRRRRLGAVRGRALPEERGVPRAGLRAGVRPARPGPEDDAGAPVGSLRRVQPRRQEALPVLAVLQARGRLRPHARPRRAHRARAGGARCSSTGRASPPRPSTP